MKKYTPVSYAPLSQEAPPQPEQFTKRLPPNRLPHRYDNSRENNMFSGSHHQNDFYKNPEQWMQQRARIARETSNTRTQTLQSFAKKYFKGDIRHAREALMHAGWPADVTVHDM